LMNSTTTPWHKIQTNFKSIARHNMMHFWSDSIFFIRCSLVSLYVWWRLPKSFKSFSAISPLGEILQSSHVTSSLETVPISGFHSWRICWCRVMPEAEGITWRQNPTHCYFEFFCKLWYPVGTNWVSW
jgi:hypothetical protein